MNDENEELKVQKHVESEPLKTSAVECPFCGYVNTYEFDEYELLLVSDKCEHFEGVDAHFPEIAKFKGETEEKLEEISREEEVYEKGYRCEGHIPDLVEERIGISHVKYIKAMSCEKNEVYGKYLRMWFWRKSHSGSGVITKDLGNNCCTVFLKTDSQWLKRYINRVEKRLEDNIKDSPKVKLSEIENLVGDMIENGYDEETLRYFVKTLRDYGD